MTLNDDKRNHCIHDRARLEELLAECHLPPEIDEDDDVHYEAEEVNPDEAVEIAKLPTKPAKAKMSVEPDLALSATPAFPAPAKAGRTVLGTLIKAIFFLLALAIVFALGAMAGRGHIWKSGPGQALVVFIEQNAGFVPKPVKEKPRAKDSNSTNEAASPESAGAETDSTEGGGLPSWDWEGWTPEDAEAVFNAGPPAGVEDNNEPSPSTPPADAAPADTSSLESSPTTAPVAASSGETNASAPPAEEWPTAIEPEISGEYNPPSDQEPGEDLDYEAMLEASEVPDATYAESAPLPPPELSGAPGLGKFVVQVETATDKTKAVGKVATLTEQGFSAYFIEGSKNSFPVRVGHFSTRQDADAAKVRLEELGYEAPSVSSLSSGG